MRQRRRRDHERRGDDQSCGWDPFRVVGDVRHDSPDQLIAVQEGPESAWLKISACVSGMETKRRRDAAGSSTKTTVESASLSVALGLMTVVCNLPSTGRMRRGSKMWQ